MADIKAGNLWITCPDCQQEFAARVHVNPGPQRRGADAVVTVSVDTEAVAQRFSEHVVTAPGKHPSFVLPSA